MVETKLQTFFVVSENALSVLGKAADTKMSDILPALMSTIDMPIRMYATQPTPDSKLNFMANLLTQGDGAGLSTPPTDDIINSFVASTIDFQTGVTTGGTFQKDSSTFSLPTTTVGEYRRMAAVYNSSGNYINVTFSAASATIGGLANPGSLFGILDGQPLGYIDLEATAATAYKTAGSATAIIENKVGANIRIFRIGASGSGGAGGDKSFKPQSISSGVLTLKGGYMILADGRELATYNGAAAGKDITLNLTSIYGSTPSNDTYYLYIDLNLLQSEQSHPDTGRKYYHIYGTAASFYISNVKPAAINLSRYVPIAVLVYNGGWSTLFSNLALRRHDNLPVAISPTMYSDNGHAIGTVGASGQLKAGHILSTKSFRAALLDTSKLSFYNLRENSNDGYGSRNLSNQGTTPFTGTDILGNTNKCAVLNGSSQYFNNNSDAFFNPGNGKPFACGGWFKATDWSPAAYNTLFSNWPAGGDRGYMVRLLNDSSGTIEMLATNTAGSSDYAAYGYGGFTDNTWHHVMMVFDYSGSNLKLYLDGVLNSNIYMANQRTITATNFCVGSQAGSSYFAGQIEEMVFANDLLLTDEDVFKLYSMRVDHYKNIASSRQKWDFKYYKEGLTPAYPLDSYRSIVDASDPDSLFLSFKHYREVYETEWQYYNPGTQGFGTPASYSIKWKKLGDLLFIKGRFEAGTVTGAEGRVYLPGGYISTGRINTIETCGDWARSAAGATQQSEHLLIEPGSGYMCFGVQNTATGGLTKLGGTSLVGNGEHISIDAVVRISNHQADYQNELSSTDKVDLRLQDTGLSNGLSVPIQNPEFLFNATGLLTDSTTSYPTYLPDDVRSFAGSQKDASGNWTPVDLTGLVSVTSSGSRYLQGNIDSLVPSASNPVRIVCSCLNPAIAVGEATGTTNGFLTAAKQLLGGLKKFLGGVSSVEYVGTEPEGWTSGATYQLTDDHKRVQNINPSTVTTIKLPSTGIKQGEIVTIRTRAAVDLAIQSSDGDAIDTIRSGFIKVMALQDDPTDVTHWDVIDYYAFVKYDDLAGTVAGSTVTADIQITRRLKQVTLTLYGTVGVAASGGTCSWAAGTVPSWLRPSDTEANVCSIVLDATDRIYNFKTDNTGFIDCRKMQVNTVLSPLAWASGENPQGTLGYSLK